MLSRLSHTSRLYLVFLTGLVLVLPAIGTDFFIDDYWHVLWLQGITVNPSSGPYSFFNLFALFDGKPVSRAAMLNYSALPWWTTDGFKMVFWRPVTELSHYLDARVFGLNLILAHLHSIAWFVVLMVLVYRFYCVLLPNKTLALLGLLVFVTEPFHAISVLWIANRNILIGAVFSLTSVLLYHHYCQKGLIRYWLLSLLALVLALLSAETGVTTLGFLAAYALFIDKGNRWYAMARIVPALLVFVAWLLIYKHLGYGASGQALMYIDPVNNSDMFIRQLLDRLPRTFLFQLFVLPKIFETVISETVFVGLGYAALLLVLAVAVFKRSRIMAFCLLAFVASVVPLAAALWHERNFLYVSIALSPLAALFMDYLWRRFWPANAAGKGLYSLMVLFRVVVPVLMLLFFIQIIHSVNGNIINTSRTLATAMHGKKVISFGLPMLDAAFVYPIAQVKGFGEPAALWNISTLEKPVSVVLNADGSIRVTGTQGIISASDMLVRDLARDPFRPGAVFTLQGLSIQVEAVNDAGNATSLLLRMENNNNYIVVLWKNREFAQMALVPGVPVQLGN